MKLAVVRGKFLNQYEMQSFVPLADRYDITAFSSLTPFHNTFPFPVVTCPSLMDVPEFPMKMQILNRLFIDAQYLFGLERKLKGFDIVHTAETYYHYTQQCLQAKKKGYVKKVVATVLENIPFNNESIWGRKGFKRRSRNELDHIIALTEKTKTALLLEGADPKKITVIGHGIDTKRFTPTRDHWKQLADQRHTIIILFSGRLEEYKGVFDVLKAATLLLKDRTISQPLRFVFAGKGSTYHRMQQKEKEYGIQNRIKHMSVPYEEMPGVYRRADIFVAPSTSTKTWSEQYCTALLEAQSMGLPIVTTKSGGIPENVGDCALFCKEGDPVSLFLQIKKFIDNPSLRLFYGQKARKRARDIHDIQIIAKKLDRVYQKVLI